MKNKGLFAIPLTLAMLCSCSAENDEQSVISETEITTIVEESPYTIHADFSNGYSEQFYEADGWTNGAPFDCIWKKENCVVSDGVMQMSINKSADGSYTGAEYRTYEKCGYGLYEVSMKPIKNSGVVSSFFVYTGPYDNDPWDEIDIEFLGKDTSIVQFNYYTDGSTGNEFVYDLGFDASEDFHTYGFKWEADRIVWYVDGDEVYSATDNVPSNPGLMMISAWNGIGVDSWIGKYDGTAPLTAEYEWVRFTAE